MLEKDFLLLDEANSMTYRVFAKLVDKNKSYNYPKLRELNYIWSIKLKTKEYDCCSHP